MQNEQKIELKGVVLNQDNIYNLVDEIKKYYNKCSINITFNDDTSKTKLSPEEFKNEHFDNARIKELDIRIYDSENYDNSFYFDNDLFGDYYIKYSNNDYEKFSTIKNIVEKWIATNSKNKSLVAVAHSLCSLIIFFLLLYIPCLILLVREYKETTLFLYSGSFTFICLGIAYGLQSFLKFIFPNALIDIGYCKRKVIRKRLGWLLVVVVIPLIISIVTSIIF